MLSNGADEAGKAHGVHDEYKGVDICGTSLLDPGGIIRAVGIFTASVGGSVEKMIRVITASLYNRKTGEMSPSG